MFKEFNYSSKSKAFFITLTIIILLAALVLIQFMVPDGFYGFLPAGFVPSVGQ